MSEDFTRVVADMSLLDEYLRPLNWIVSYCQDGNTDSTRLLVISPFEANELIPLFRSGSLVTQLRMFAARLHEKQDLLFYTPELTIPATSTQQLPYCELLDAELLVFSGTIYFACRRELLFYCSFLGLPPSFQAFEDDFVLPPKNLRKQSVNGADSSSEMLVIRRFSQNPRELAKRIVELRFGPIRRGSHVESILLNFASKS